MVTQKAQPDASRPGQQEPGEPEARRRPRTLRPRRDWLAQGLREIYEESLNDPIPDSFRVLLDELERKEQGQKDPKASEAGQEAEEPPVPRGGPQGGGSE